MARPSVSQLRGIGQLSTNYRWNLNVVKPPAAVPGFPSGNDLNLRCISSTVPKMTGSAVDIDIRGQKLKRPGIYDYDHTITLTFIEAIDNKINIMIDKWKEACWSTDIGVQQDYADLESVFTLTRLDNKDKGIWLYTLIGCFLTEYESIGGSLENSPDITKPTMTLAYDFFKSKPL